MSIKKHDGEEITKQDVEDAIGLILSWIELDKDGAVASMTIGCPNLNHSYNIRIERVKTGASTQLNGNGTIQ
jgi:hypothetical protein